MLTVHSTAAGGYHYLAWSKDYSRLQILTVADLLRGAGVQMPPQYGTFRQAPRVAAAEAQQGRLELE